ncbi:MAG: DNA-binding protein [Candidatus Bathyarchaeota archaeon]|jgi:predicted DNA-binding protein with PD1-like motif|nr:DNA-binding protein [Candidatus Bathyarchaeota archaeon A05DMB-3]MDH7606585.1 DNA-binding protein [Candidatus Bathyarchaeota archaeon]
MVEGKIGKIIFSRIKTDEDLAEAIKERVEKSRVKAGVIIAIGSLKRATLGYYREGEYKYIRLDGPLEIASCMGNIAVDENGNVVVHAHIVVTNEKGEAFGGHLMKESPVGATAELIIIEGDGINLKRVLDEKTKLRLLDLG